MRPNSILVDIRAPGAQSAETATTGFTLTLTTGTESVKGTFDCELNGRLADVLQKVDLGRCNLDDIRDIGSELYSGMFSSKAEKEAFSSVRRSVAGDDVALVRLSLPNEFLQLPWEGLYDETFGAFIGTHPNYCIVREPSGDEGAKDEVGGFSRRPLSMLVVIPDGSGLNVEQEWHNIEQICEQFPQNIKPERFGGRVTPDLLGNRLENANYNIVHFIGHGEVVGDDSFTIRLNDPSGGEEFWMPGETFASLFFRRSPQLVILNCCLSAAASPQRTLSGIAPALLRAGVLGVVAMRYEIPDQVAAEFAGSFYHELLGGRTPGWVDSAVSRARQAIYRNATSSTTRGFITPVLYLKKGREHLFDIPVTQEKPARLSTSTHVEKKLPENLDACMERLQKRECVAVLGPGVLSSSVLTRSGKKPPSMCELAERLARECGYPWEQEFAVKSCTEDWHAGLLLPWVCQHYQRIQKRYALIRSLDEAYTGAETPPLFRSLTRLGMPGIVYTNFDGLVEKAFQESNIPVQTVAAVDQRFESDGTPTVLMCPRGLLRFKDSLILTEEDHEKLYERVARWDPVLRDRMRGQVGRSTLFLGVSPRDELVRRIAGQLLAAGEDRMQGPTFFFCNYHSIGDDAYWSKYDVRWINYDIHDFSEILRGLTQ